jgi:hypothetical protein
VGISAMVKVVLMLLGRLTIPKYPDTMPSITLQQLTYADTNLTASETTTMNSNLIINGDIRLKVGTTEDINRRY